MTVNAGNTTSQVVGTGLIITREAVPALAKRLAENLFYMARDHYRYMSDASGEEDFAQSIGYHLHVILNQMNVDKRECKKCGESQQAHEWVGGYCSGGNGSKFEAKP